MIYDLNVDFLENELPVKTKSFQFSEDRWFTARIQVITVLKAFYSENWDRITLYLEKIDRVRLEAGAYHPKATIRAVLKEADFSEYIFKEMLSFEQIKQNLIKERDLYKLYSDFNFLTENVQLSGAKSIELLKGTNKLLELFFQRQ